MNAPTKTIDLVAVILEFVELQNNLILAFKQTFPQITDWQNLLDCPQNGDFWLQGETWKFQRHGVGICFTGQKYGKIVDAHFDIYRYPKGFDSWRLCQYLESIGTEKIYYCSEYFEVWDDDREFCDADKLEELLKVLLKDGKVAIALKNRKLYQLKD